jgi:hypothetical protein
VDKVDASIFFTLASRLLVTVCRRRAFSGSGAARGRRRR